VRHDGGYEERYGERHKALSGEFSEELSNEL
jgi:hypothetical protein